jgi:hypothetical protein
MFCCGSALEAQRAGTRPLQIKTRQGSHILPPQKRFTQVLEDRAAVAEFPSFLIREALHSNSNHNLLLGVSNWTPPPLLTQAGRGGGRKTVQELVYATHASGYIVMTSVVPWYVAYLKTCEV